MKEPVLPSKACFDLLEATKLWASRQSVSVEAWDSKGHALFVNSAWKNLWQMPENVLIGSGYSILSDSQFHQKPVWEFLAQGFKERVALDTPPSYYDPKEEDDRPGTARWTEGRIVPLWTGEDKIDERNGPLAYIILLHDVTRQMQSRIRLVRAGNEIQDGLRKCARLKKHEILRWGRGKSDAAKRDGKPGTAVLQKPGTPIELVLAAPPPDEVLSPGELRALSLLAEGYSPKEISATLGKSEKTVYTQLSIAAKKLGLKSLTQLTVYACRWYS